MQTIFLQLNTDSPALPLVRLPTPEGLWAGVGGPRGLELSSWADKGYHTGLSSTLALAMSIRT